MNPSDKGLLDKAEREVNENPRVTPRTAFAKRPILDNLHKIDTKVGEEGVTIRLGMKWYDQVDNGDSIDLQETTEGDIDTDTTRKIVGRATVTGKLYVRPFRDIPARYIENEHEESSRLYSGLVASMKKAYGEKFDPEVANVTILIYKRTS